MATRKLGDVSVGEIVKLKENGTSVDYIVVNQGKPSSVYDDSCDGTWLLRQDCMLTYKWDTTFDNDYDKSAVHAYLNSTTTLNRYESGIKSAIKQAKIPFCSSWADAEKIESLSCKLFLLSAIEAGIVDTQIQDGSVLDYFISGNSPEANEKRIAEYDNISVKWWLRTLRLGYSEMMWLITASGSYEKTYPTASNVYVRPALIIDQSKAYVLDDNTVFVNSVPNTPSSITIPETIRGGEDTSIIWSAATDPDGSLDGYIVERSYNGGTSWTQIYQGRSTSTTTTIPFGTETVMFRVCAYDTYGEKSGWTTSPNRVVINNHAPSAPLSISVPLTPQGGESLSVTWTASTDADGNLEGYELERQWDGTGAFTQIYKGAALSFQDDIPKGEHTSVVYRVRAYDSFDAYSSYTTSPSRTIDNNTAPVIACDLSGDLGEKSEGFSIPYTVSDAEQQAVTVIERVGDLVKRTYKVTLDQQNTFEVTGEYFQKILNGAQTVQIVATDSAGKSSTLSLTFTKAVHKAVITLSEPLAVEEQITVAVLAITGKIPADATQLIELTNNGNDPEPVWEDATADVKAGRNHPFTNKTQTNGWAFNFRVTVERGESGEDGNIVSIQGGFQ